MSPTSSLERPPAATVSPRLAPAPPWHWPLLLGLWLLVYLASAATPTLLDDADATHAEAAQAMLRTGDWVTLHVDGIRYLEKPPLPYWLTAISLRLFGRNTFAVHLPLALAVLGLAVLGYLWAARAFGRRAALLTGVFTLTATGVFLFTRVFIPDALLSLLLALCLYAALRALDPTTPHRARFAYVMWVALACAVLTKGLVAIVFLAGTLLVYGLWTGEWRQWRALRPGTGLLLFLATAAPWHILAGLRNTGGADGHGFFWFYFINEHVLRFLGRRIPRDYNKLPWYLYWSLHLVWLFPWSLFAPAAALLAWRTRGTLAPHTFASGQASFARRSALLLSIFSALILIFFSLSTNQEYYTFPVYLPLLLLLAGALTVLGRNGTTSAEARALRFAYGAFTVLGAAVAVALAYGLWSARHLPFVADIGSLLAHRGVGDYTLSMSHFFDLTGPSFAALRLPATLALLAFAIGPAIALTLYRRARPTASLLTVAGTAAVFLVAAHIALVRFAPMLSSASFARTIQRLESAGEIRPGDEVMLFGDQAYGSSIPFYLNREVDLVDGRSTSMLFGSTFPDALPIFLTHKQLLASWGHGPRKVLFVPLEKRDEVDSLLGSQPVLLQEISGKALLTDRPLRQPSPANDHGALARP